MHTIGSTKELLDDGAVTTCGSGKVMFGLGAMITGSGLVMFSLGTYVYQSPTICNRKCIGITEISSSSPSC